MLRNCIMKCHGKNDSSTRNGGRDIWIKSLNHSHSNTDIVNFLWTNTFCYSPDIIMILQCNFLGKENTVHDMVDQRTGGPEYGYIEQVIVLQREIHSFVLAMATSCTLCMLCLKCSHSNIGFTQQ